MAKSAVAAQVHEALDVHGHFAAQVALHRHLGDPGTQRLDLSLGQISHPGGAVDAAFVTELLCL